MTANGAVSAAACFRASIARGAERGGYLLVRSKSLDDGRQWQENHTTDISDHHGSEFNSQVSVKNVRRDPSLLRVAASVGAMTAFCKVSANLAAYAMRYLLWVMYSIGPDE